MTDPTPIATTELPTVITDYLRAHLAREVDAALALCTDDITVVDEGNTYRRKL